MCGIKIKKYFFAFLFLSFLKPNCQTTFTCSGASTVCSCGSGAKGEYYANYYNDVQNYFTTNTVGLTRTDATINFATDNGWGAIVPPAGGSLANPDFFSTRWTGRIFLAAGTYTFWLTSDDASYLWFANNALVANPTTASAFISNGGQHAPTTVSAVAIFTSTCLQDFKIHFGEFAGNNRCVLEYGSTGLSITRQVVPNNALCACQSLSSPLPVGLIDFYAEAKSNQVVLNWLTASELNCKSFTVYKSNDAVNWHELGTKDGNGTTSLKQSYTMTDEAPYQGLTYYYLMQTDFDGKSKSYNVIFFDANNTANFLSLFPNPMKENLKLRIADNVDNNCSIELFDALNKKINVPMHQLNAHEIEIETSQLEKGYYTLIINTPYRRLASKVLKN